MMKADFIKWWTHNGNGPHRGTDLEYHEGSINQFAEEYAQQEAIEFADYISKNWFKMDVNKYVFPHSGGVDPNTMYTIAEIYEKFYPKRH